MRTHGETTLLPRNRLVTRVCLPLLLIAVVATNQFPPVSGSGSLPANAEFAVLDFTSSSITWSLKIVVDGLLKSPILAVQVGTGIVYRYDAQYDRILNTTTIEESLPSDFTYIGGQFPREFRTLRLYFAINASVRETFGVQLLKLPTQNYVGLFTLNLNGSQTREAFADASPELNRYGEVYSLFAQIQRSPDAAQYSEITMVQIPGMLKLIWCFLAGVLIAQILFWPRPRLRTVPRKKLLNTNYFAIVVGILFLLPVYMISLKPLQAPIPITEADVLLFQLIEYFGILLITSFIVSLLMPKDV